MTDETLCAPIEVSSADINRIFAEDPLSLTDEDIAKTIKAYRDMRYKFNLGDTKAGSIKPKAVPKALKGIGDDLLSTKIEL